jgi:glucose-6-phosphate 1-dehydrogenase
VSTTQRGRPHSSEQATGTKSDYSIPDDHVIVLFGGTGDLARRKLLPGLFRLAEAGLAPERFRIIGAARRDVSGEAFRQLARDSISESGSQPEGESWDRFAASLRFVGIGEGIGALRQVVERSRTELGGDPALLHYLSVPPTAAAGIVTELGELGLSDGARIIMEKPFGTDLASARRLNDAVLSVFEESRVFRIDHYLGREAVQNLLAVRFANGMFEPVWNREHIDHVQIDVPETLAIGMRGDFYDHTGAFRDMVVTHLFQVLGFVAMEPPTALEPKTLMSERAKVFDSMRALEASDLVRGQYLGYRDEEGVAPDSDTETFVAVRAHVDNWRWSGVPFYLRTGKRLAESRHLLTIAFNQPPRRMFPVDCRHVAESFGFDHLTFELGDPGRISVSFLAKVPGPVMTLGEAHMNFSYASSFVGPEQALDPYERLIHDVMVDDRTLFTTSDAIERLWEISQPALDQPPALRTYAPGSTGPSDMHGLIAPREWHLPGDHI